MRNVNDITFGSASISRNINLLNLCVRSVLAVLLGSQTACVGTEKEPDSDVVRSEFYRLVDLPQVCIEDSDCAIFIGKGCFSSCANSIVVRVDKLEELRKLESQFLKIGGDCGTVTACREGEPSAVCINGQCKEVRR